MSFNWAVEARRICGERCRGLQECEHRAQVHGASLQGSLEDIF